MAAMLVLLMVGIKKSRTRGATSGTVFIPCLMKIHLLLKSTWEGRGNM